MNFVDNYRRAVRLTSDWFGANEPTATEETRSVAAALVAGLLQSEGNVDAIVITTACKRAHEAIEGSPGVMTLDEEGGLAE